MPKNILQPYPPHKHHISGPLANYDARLDSFG